MFYKFTAGMDPKVIKTIKVTAVTVAALTGAIVVGMVLYKTGVISDGVEITEENAETAIEETA